MIKKYIRASFQRSKTLFFIKFALLTILVAVAFEVLSKEKQKLKFNPKPISNHHISVENLMKNDKNKLLDEKSGKLKVSGWGTNLEERFIVNHQDASLKFFGKNLNWLNYRAWDFFMIYTEDHVITIPFANFASGCSTSVNIFPRSSKDFVSERLKQVVLLKKCPEIDLDSVKLSNDSIDYNGLQIQISKEEDLVSIRIDAKKINFTADLVMNEKDYESQFLAMPLKDDHSLYFANNKKFGMPLRGQYEVNGKIYMCYEGNNCAGMYDLGRGHFTYFTNWFWATITTVLKAEEDDEEVHFSLNMGDGLGVNYHSSEKVSPDFINIDGKVYKLDQTELGYNEKNYSDTHYFQTHQSSKQFPDRGCTLEFQPLGLAYDGLYAVVLAFHQHLMFGHYSGKCIVDGKIFVLDQVLGAVEHVKARF